MDNLETIKDFLEKNLGQYNYSINENLSGRFITAKSDTFRGAQIYLSNSKIQIIPGIPTWKGRILFGAGIGLAKYFVRNFNIVGETITNKLTEQGFDNEIKFVADSMNFEPTEKGKKIEHIVVLLLGIGLIWVGYLLFHEFSELERTGGEIRLNWIIVLMYESLGKEITCFIIALGGFIVTLTRLKKMVFG